jgi:hypothetical protein
MNTKLGKKKLKLNDQNSSADKADANPASDSDRYIPADVKREVRQRCGFGCVICGLPLYDYEHMNEWAIVKEHVAADITLLCVQHHREKTNGLLSIKAVRKANASPINTRGQSAPYLFHVQPWTMTIVIGDNGFWYDNSNPTSKMVVLSIDSEPIIWFNREEDDLLLNLTLYDTSNIPILKLRDNELVYSTFLWDITLIGKTLTIRCAPRHISLSLTVSPNENLIAIEKASLLYNGYQVLIDDKGMTIGGVGGGLRNCRVKGSGHLINVGGGGNGVGLAFGGERTYEVK